VRIPIIAALLLITACGGSAPPPRAASTSAYRGGAADRSRVADAEMIAIPAGPFVAGSGLDERQRAYEEYRETSGRDTAHERSWFETEREPHQVILPAYLIDATPVTNGEYAEFVADTGARAPGIDAAAWKRQRFVQDFDSEIARFVWRGGVPPAGREDHPVVLVTWHEAAAYCAWRGALVNRPRQLPTADELEKASRGEHGRRYPWGDAFDPAMLASAVGRPRDTTPVGSFPAGASPYGVLDAAGNVFQWTSTPMPGHRELRIVKGSAWDDYGGVGRGASMHGRPPEIRHGIIGFRCAGR
jgi:formylglycine-generating enzyme required for sulfatase activity